MLHCLRRAYGHDGLRSHPAGDHGLAGRWATRAGGCSTHDLFRRKFVDFDVAFYFQQRPPLNCKKITEPTVQRSAYLFFSFLYFISANTVNYPPPNLALLDSILNLSTRTICVLLFNSTRS